MVTALSTSQEIRGDIIRNAFEELSFLGQAVKEQIIEELETRGVVLDDKNLYSMEHIEAQLLDIFGPDTAGLLVRKVRIGIKD